MAESLPPFQCQPPSVAAIGSRSKLHRRLLDEALHSLQRNIQRKLPQTTSVVRAVDFIRFARRSRSRISPRLGPARRCRVVRLGPAGSDHAPFAGKRRRVGKRETSKQKAGARKARQTAPTPVSRRRGAASLNVFTALRAYSLNGEPGSGSGKLPHDASLVSLLLDRNPPKFLYYLYHPIPVRKVHGPNFAWPQLRIPVRKVYGPNFVRLPTTHC